MDEKTGLLWLDEKLKDLKDRDTDLLRARESVNPEFESLKIIVIYIVLGILWVLFSNNLISFFVKDEIVFRQVLTYKGWLYVSVTGFIFYIVIRNRMLLFKKAVNTMFEGYEELTASHEELLAMEEELMNQYDQIKAHSQALAVSEQRYQTLAYYDTITDLPNRIMFEEETEKIIGELEESGQRIAIIYIDVDNFKHINDTLGHKVGDEFISYLGKILMDCIKPPDIVARLGGDEFAVTLVDIEDEDSVIDKINYMFEHIRKPWSMGNHKFYTTVSMGVALYPDHGTNLVELMQNADAAMFEVKERGKDGYCIFTQQIKDKTLHYIQMSNELRAAIDREEFVLYYQPQVELTTSRIIGVEALIRWQHPEKGLVSPVSFIPFAEEAGYISEIGKWVFKTACKQKREWRQLGHTCVKVAINLSGKELSDSSLVDNIKEILETNCTTCQRLEVEITETAIMTNLEKAIGVLEELRELGVTVALDDFGTGYSSLTYLQKLPIDVLKVDREFISNIIDKGEEFYIFKAVIDLAQNLGLTVVAEGIETREQSEFLIEHGCNIGQGYYFSKPVLAKDIEVFLEKGFLKDEI